MSGHTPGPWRWVQDDAETTIDLRGPDDRDVLSIYESHGGGQRPTEADGHLIAAAPELLAACKNALRLLDTMANTQAAKVLVAAIAKAEGRS
jgi:hypothetical protein